MRRRYYILSAVSGAALLVAMGGSAQALIPVFDGAAVAEMVRSVVEAEKAFALQVTQYSLAVKSYIGEYFGWVTEYRQLMTELESYYTEGLMLMNFAHHPTFGKAMGIMNQAGLGNVFPFSPYALANLINGHSYNQGGFGEINGLLNLLSGFSNAAYTQNQIYVPTDGSWASQQLIDNANSIAASQGMALGAYNDYRNHMAVLPELRQTAASADTMKDAADVNNAFQAEIAWNLNQLGQANAAAYYAAAARDARVQRDEERLACELESFRRGGNACPTGQIGGLVGGGGGPNGGGPGMPVGPAAPLVGVGGNPVAMLPPQPVPPAQYEQPPAFEIPVPPPQPQN